MALSPKDLALSVSEKSEADNIEAKIDRELRSDYIPGANAYVYIGTISNRVFGELCVRYKKAGWKNVKKDPTNTARMILEV